MGLRKKSSGSFREINESVYSIKWEKSARCVRSMMRKFSIKYWCGYLCIPKYFIDSLSFYVIWQKLSEDNVVCGRKPNFNSNCQLVCVKSIMCLQTTTTTTTPTPCRVMTIVLWRTKIVCKRVFTALTLTWRITLLNAPYRFGRNKIHYISSTKENVIFTMKWFEGQC